MSKEFELYFCQPKTDSKINIDEITEILNDHLKTTFDDPSVSQLLRQFEIGLHSADGMIHIELQPADLKFPHWLKQDSTQNDALKIIDSILAWGRKNYTEVGVRITVYKGMNEMKRRMIVVEAIEDIIPHIGMGYSKTIRVLE